MPKPVRALVSAVVALRRGDRGRLRAGARRRAAAGAGPARGARGRASSSPSCSRSASPAGRRRRASRPAFAFALLVTHGVEVTVLVSRSLGVIAADAIRRPRAVKVLYNAGAVRDLLGARRGCSTRRSPARRSRSRRRGAAEFAALVPAGLAVRARQQRRSRRCRRRCCAAGPVVRAARARGRLRGRARRSSCSRSPRSSSCVAARDLWLVPLARRSRWSAIQLGSRQALINEAHARVDPLTGAFSRPALEQRAGAAARRSPARRAGGRRARPRRASPTSTTRSATAPATRCSSTVATRIVAAVGQAELVARTGGDAFAVALRRRAAPTTVVGADRRGARAAGRRSPGWRSTCAPSRGIAAAPARDAGDAAAPGRRRAAGRQGAAARAASASSRRWRRRRRSGSRSRRSCAAAIGAGELVLHYQPKIDVRTGALAGVEALVRWNRPGPRARPAGRRSSTSPSAPA